MVSEVNKGEYLKSDYDIVRSVNMGEDTRSDVDVSASRIYREC